MIILWYWYNYPIIYAKNLACDENFDFWDVRDKHINGCIIWDLKKKFVYIYTYISSRLHSTDGPWWGVRIYVCYKNH